MGLVIRKVDPERDAEDLLRMGRSFADQSPTCGIASFDPDSLLAFLREAEALPHLRFLIAELNGKIIGAAGAVLWPFFFNRAVLQAQELFWWIEPEARGTDAARLLREALEDWAREKGARVFFMIALEGVQFERMAKLYARADYRPFERTFGKEL